jgi:hypothetical protein
MLLVFNLILGSCKDIYEDNPSAANGEHFLYTSIGRKLEKVCASNLITQECRSKVYQRSYPFWESATIFSEIVAILISVLLPTIEVYLIFIFIYLKKRIR